MMLLLLYYINVETASVLLSKEARMKPLEPNPLSIRHDVVVYEFREFGISTVKCQDGRTKKSKSTQRFHILWNLNENILKFSRNLTLEI